MGFTLRQYFDANQKEDEQVVGVVADNLDPLKLGRIRVRIPGYTNDEAGIPTDFLPWMNMKRVTGTGTGKGVQFAVPAIGTKVMCKRSIEDDYNWTVESELMTSNHEQLGLYQGNYPKVHGSSDADNTYHTVDMLAHRLFFHHTSGTTAEIIASGTTNISIRDDLNVQVDDNGTWNYDGYLKNTIKEWRHTTVFLTDTLWVKGGRNEIVDLSRVTNIGAGCTTTIGASRGANVGGCDTLEVAGVSNTKIEGYESTKIGGHQTLEVEGDVAEVLKATRSVIVEDDESLTVNGEIVITCNGGDITIVSTGSINIAANESINLTAGTSINCSAPVINLDD